MFKQLHLRWLLLSLLALAMSNPAISQSSSNYPKISEDMFKETRWKYTETYHAPSKTVIHEAKEDYKFFIYFKENYDYQYFLNGQLNKGTWLIDVKGSEIYFDFRNIKWWKVAEISKHHLTLEFKMGKGVFHYIFDAVEEKNTPFSQPLSSNGEVDAFADLYEEKVKTRELTKWEKKRFKARNKPKKKMDNITPEPPPAIEIQMVGGGYYGGVDPVLKNYVHLKPNGRLIYEFESMQKGAMKTKKDVTREDMEKLVQFIERKNFFEFDNTYDCVTSDCRKRKRMKPTPVPLRLSVRYGDQRKVITVAIYGRDDRRSGYIAYPEDLELIIQNIMLLVGEDSGL